MNVEELLKTVKKGLDQHILKDKAKQVQLSFEDIQKREQYSFIDCIQGLENEGCSLNLHIALDFTKPS